jgi:hypothetical protein
MERRRAQDERFELRRKALILEDPKSDTSGSVHEDSETEPESEFPPPQNTHLKQSVSKPQGYKRYPFVAPDFPKEDRVKANARISAALDQVDPSVHLNPQGKRITATRYVGNLEFNASEQDQRKSLDSFFKRIRVEKITIPRVQGRSKYSCIEISWAHHAQGEGPARADTGSAAPTSPHGGVLRHVLRLPQQVPWTGQPRRTTGLEWLGFYGDTWAALRA